MAELFPMKITLAVDTATARTQFAILKGSELLWQEIEDEARITMYGSVKGPSGTNVNNLKNMSNDPAEIAIMQSIIDKIIIAVSQPV